MRQRRAVQRHRGAKCYLLQQGLHPEAAVLGTLARRAGALAGSKGRTLQSIFAKRLPLAGPEDFGKLPKLALPALLPVLGLV